MPFLKDDLYLASGTSKLINNWVDPVYKFDSSSFYNWEQDNLPIYDLEDRDDYLYEMHGYPTSAVTGMMLTVSDCGVNNKNVFASLADVVDALPNTIRFPIIVEVAASGNLGELRLENLHFEGSGAGLEIINRGFAKTLCGSASPSATISTLTGTSAITLFSSVDLSSTMTDSSSVGASNTVYQATTALNWWDNYTRAFVLAPEWANNTDSATRTVSISTNFKDSGSGFLGSTNQYNVSIYQDYSASSDISLTHDGDGTANQRPGISLSESRTTGFVYANALERVQIKDCNGRIYVRGFCVDGGNQADINAAGGVQRTENGFDVQNSEVVLENCTAARCKTSGLNAVNSNVTLNRGFIAFRNYELTTGSRRLDTKVLTNPTAGIRAVNSELTLSASISENKGLPLDSPFCSYRNLHGIELTNSILKTPYKSRKGTNIEGTSVAINRGSQTVVLQSFFNLYDGIGCTNSTIDTSERVASFQNNRGLVLDNSQCKVSEITIDHNQGEGLLSTNSTFNYNKNATLAGYTAGPFYPVTSFYKNGQHVHMLASKFVPTYVSGMDSFYERLEFKENHGTMGRKATVLRESTVPAVRLDNGSFMEAVASKTTLEDSTATGSKYQVFNGIKGAAFRVTNNSELKLSGVRNDNTFVLGTYNWREQQFITGLYAGSNSRIFIAGPTTIVQMGVDALAEEGSTIEFGPHAKNGIIDVSGWNLINTNNHTMVQLHATRACLVANKNSHIHMHDLGDYHSTWASKYIASDNDADYNDTNTFQTSSFQYYGKMQFFPNPYMSYGVANLEAQATPLGAISFDRTWLDLATGSNISNYSAGGLCVRAVDDSQVTVKNVTFPCGWLNASEAYYDVSAENGCGSLRIWNIADNSELHASYLSVSGHHPQDCSGVYYGPAAVYTSGASVPLSGAPVNTPNTQSMSILDSFGKGMTAGGLGFYGKTNSENIGPFRVYISPSPKAKWLGYPVNLAGEFFNANGGANNMGWGSFVPQELKAGPVYQVIAQGYNPSGDASAGPTASVSAIYEDLGFKTYIESLPAFDQTSNAASSFFYTSGMLAECSPSIWFDKSAMNAFANAKNGTLSTSGRKKFINYYRATTDYPGEGWWQADAGYGLGFGSANLFDLDRYL